MARKSLIVKAQRKQKFLARQYNRCPICGRSRAFFKKIWHLPYMFSKYGFERRNTRGYQIQLVKRMNLVRFAHNWNVGILE